MNTTLIRKLIVQNQIKTWQDVYNYTNPTEMSKAFGRSPKHWAHLKMHPYAMSVLDMDSIMRVLNLSLKQFYGLVGGSD